MRMGVRGARVQGFACDGEAPSRHPAGRARPVPVANARGGLGDGRRGARGGRRGRRAAKPSELVDDRGAGERRRSARVRLPGRHQARERARRAPGSTVARPPCARRRRLHRGLHRLPAPGRRPRGDRRRRRLRVLDYRLRSDPRVLGDGAHERARAAPRAAARGARAPRGRPTSRRSTCRSSRSRRCCRRGARLPGGPHSTCSRSSSPSSSSAAVASAREAWSAIRRCGARRCSPRSERPPSASARRCAATTPRGCPGRRATARRSSGWRRRRRAACGAQDAAALEAMAREVEP